MLFFILFINLSSTYQPTLHCSSPGAASMKIMNVRVRAQNRHFYFVYTWHRGFVMNVPVSLLGNEITQWTLTRMEKKKGFVSLHYLTVLIATFINTYFQGSRRRFRTQYSLLHLFGILLFLMKHYEVIWPCLILERSVKVTSGSYCFCFEVNKKYWKGNFKWKKFYWLSNGGCIFSIICFQINMKLEWNLY